MVDSVTGDTLLDAAVPSVADQLTRYWNYLGDGAALPDRAKMETMARGVLTDKKLVSDGKTLLDLGALNETQKEKLSGFGLDVNALNAFADKPKREKLAKAIDDGAQATSGVWSFISGLFSWLMSGFEGGFEGLWKKVGEAGAENASQSVQQSVGAAMANDKDLQAFKPYMGVIDQAVRDKAMETATGKKSEETRETVVPLPKDTAALKQMVVAEVGQQLDKEITNNKILDTDLGKLFAGEHADERVNAFKGKLKEIFTKVATDTSYALGDKAASQMAPEEFRQAIRNKLSQELSAMDIPGNDGKPVKMTQWYQDNWSTVGKWMGSLPSDPQKLPDFLADKTMAQVKDEPLGLLKEVRGLADHGYRIADILKLISNPLLAAAEQYHNPNYKTESSYRGVPKPHNPSGPQIGS